MGAELGHCVRDELWKLCSAHSVILCLQRVTTLEFNQFHLEVGWCVFNINYKQITEQFKPRFLDIKVGKSPGNLSFSTVHMGTWRQRSAVSYFGSRENGIGEDLLEMNSSETDSSEQRSVDVVTAQNSRRDFVELQVKTSVR